MVQWFTCPHSAYKSQVQALTVTLALLTNPLTDCSNRMGLYTQLLIPTDFFFPDSGVTPWLPLNPDYPLRNVESQSDPALSYDGSNLNVYKSLSIMRHRPEVMTGGVEFLTTGTVFAFSRWEQTIVVK